jgi:soluble lytic murein transglycosylase
MKRLLLTLTLFALALGLVACDVASAPPPERTLPTPAAGAPAPLPAGVAAAPVPGELLQRALALLDQGDDAAAAVELSELLQRYPETREALPARYHLAVYYASRGRWTSAGELLNWFLAQAQPDDPLRAPALFWLARTHEAAGAHEAAVEAFGAYRALDTALEPYAALREAAQAQVLGQNELALAGLLHVARSPLVRGERAGAFEKAIALLRAGERPDEALALYPELLELAQEPAYRARILSEAAALAEAQGQSEQARAWLLSLVNEESLAATPQAGFAVDQLLAAGDAALSPATAGLIYAANERWSDALAQLELASASEPDLARRAELMRRQGLALRAEGNFAGALAFLAAAGAQAPDSQAGRQSQLDWVQTLGQSGETERAVEGYVEYAAAYPDDPRAPEALSRAAILRERMGDSEGVLQSRLELGMRYPASEQGRAALHQAAMTLFLSQRLDEAAQAWGALAAANSGPARAQGAFWQARVARTQGAEARAQELFSEAVAAAPTSYEGARAVAELGGPPPGDLPLAAPISAEQWAELEAWLVAWAGTPAQPPQELAARSERARLLAEVGLLPEANREWLEGVSASGDPGANLALARAAHEADMAYPALIAASTLARQAPPEAPPQPLAMRRLLFPTPYPALVTREASAHGVDPRLFYALMRQESLFNPSATSWVGARGLGQVMPATGEGIAQNLGVSDFVLDDLYRPAVSIRFGTFYLGRRISDMEGSVHGALAAYNGGLGNAQRWAGGSRVADPDLFSEVIDFPETKGYVRSVYAFWGVYQGLYAAP